MKIIPHVNCEYQMASESALLLLLFRLLNTFWSTYDAPGRFQQWSQILGNGQTFQIWSVDNKVHHSYEMLQPLLFSDSSSK